QIRLGWKLEDIILDRARGHVVSKLDPVTVGVHCAIGSAKRAFTNTTGGGDYVVTSTLASQCPPAVGRALAFSLADALTSDNAGRNAIKPLSFVTIGDGSVHNAHFLSAFNLASHARYRKKKCPVVFGVSDNGLSISYSTAGYADYLFSQRSSKQCGVPQTPGSVANRDGVPIFKANGCDMMDVYDKTLQAARYSRNYSAPSLVLYRELTRRFGHAATDRQTAYLDADTIESMAESDVISSGIAQAVQLNALSYSEAKTRFDEIGEMFKGRVIDFPPDETTLLGTAMGISQVGLLPIIEIPYAKCTWIVELTCFMRSQQVTGSLTNSVLMEWSSAFKDSIEARSIHLFLSVFGGNFHTHNMISHVPPGVDVVCYSNGLDFARGFRNAIIQARKGRVVVLIDCTNLLNMRHLHEKDRGWETTYPSEDEVMGFHDVRQFGTAGKDLIVTYGNGVVTALQARRSLAERKVISKEHDLDIIDAPYISDVPDGLRDALSNEQYERVLFCDICKEGPGSNILSSTIMSLKNQGILPSRWDFVAAPRTYNPLGRTITFLDEDDIISAYKSLRG
ncbi:hypothetical protein ACHAXA_005657, partial [Cyclostephanos tholiformis]